MTRPEQDEALGRYVRLTREIERENKRLAADLRSFLSTAQQADRAPRPGEPEVSTLAGAGWERALSDLIVRGQRMRDLAEQANKDAARLGEPKVRVLVTEPPGFAT